MPHLSITPALMPSGMGLSVANICMTLVHLEVKVYVDAITRMVYRHSDIIREYAEMIKAPCIPKAMHGPF